MIKNAPFVQLPAWSFGGSVLFRRIDAILGMIPSDFPKRIVLEAALREQQAAIDSTVEEMIWGRWTEVANALNDHLPDPTEVAWSADIARLFSSTNAAERLL